MTNSTSSLDAKGIELIRLHTDETILSVVNVWDVISATVIADLDGTTALATASHSIAATFGYEDGEKIPLSLMLDMIGRITAATDLPVSADLEAGYGNAGETIRRAIGVGVVGANLEDQMKPFDEAVAAVRASVAAAQAEGVSFALNARTDVFSHSGDRTPEEVVAEAIKRGKAFLEEGATCVFVPGALDEPTIETLVAGIGRQKISVIGIPGLTAAPARLQELGVARISYGPFTQRLALTALADAGKDLLAGGTLPTTIRNLN